jgi:uncharacterized protein (DUF342 family)
MNFYEILMCLAIFASIIGAYWKLKLEMAKVQKDIEQLKMENETAKENLEIHKHENRSELNTFIAQNNQAHDKIDLKLDKIVDFLLNKKA